MTKRRASPRTMNRVIKRERYCEKLRDRRDARSDMKRRTDNGGKSDSDMELDPVAPVEPEDAPDDEND